MQEHAIAKKKMGPPSIISGASASGAELFELLRDDLVAIEREFGRDTVSSVPAITDIGEYLRGGGGKRIRPALLLLSAKLCNYEGRGAVKIGRTLAVNPGSTYEDGVLQAAIVDLDSKKGEVKRYLLING